MTTSTDVLFSKSITMWGSYCQPVYHIMALKLCRFQAVPGLLRLHTLFGLFQILDAVPNGIGNALLLIFDMFYVLL